MHVHYKDAGNSVLTFYCHCITISLALNSAQCYYIPGKERTEKDIIITLWGRGPHPASIYEPHMPAGNKQESLKSMLELIAVAAE